MSLAFIQATINEDMQKVDRVIHDSLKSEVALINQISTYIVQSGGKRLRPALVLLSAGLFGDIKPQHHQLAAVVEFIHTATLLHDDVVDESDMRRGQATANSLYGNASSVLVGDFLYSRAFQMMVKIENMQVMSILSEATNTIAEGEVIQLLNIHNDQITEAEYLKVIHYKTAKLFESASRLGAVISHATIEDQTALARYGMHLGTAFQLIDDVLDLSGDAESIGKNLGDDIAEGKPTLPLIIAMQLGSESQRNCVKNAIQYGGLDYLADVIKVVKATNALEMVNSLAKKEADLAISAIEYLPKNTYKECLIELAMFSVNRNF